jgi:phosphoglycolate phosphatase
MPLVGFDLDMTLIDSRPQILAAFAALAGQTRTAIDIDAVDRRLGVKLEDELAHWYAPSELAPAAALYRRHYVRLAASATVALPGAREALAAVREAGGSTAIVTAKHETSVGPCLAAAGLEADAVYTFVHGPEKAAVLRRLGATAYVGDTPPDMQAAVTAGVVGIGVATGSFGQGELRAAGATATLATLRAFGPCLRDHIVAAAGQP